MSRFVLPEEYFEYGNLDTTYRFKDNTKEQTLAKEKDIERILDEMAKGLVREKSYKVVGEADCDIKANKLLDELNDDGTFPDLPFAYKNAATGIGKMTFIIAEKYHHNLHGKRMADIPEKVINGLLSYMKEEVDYEDKGPVRFHSGCFKAPTCAVNIFLSLLPDMLEIENSSNHKYQEFYNYLCDVMMQCWLLPLRGDETDKHPVTMERFRNHTWWVGGNATPFRPVHYVAICLRNVRMIDTMLNMGAEATKSKVSHTTKTFWTEGICADGWGWGHGPQAYNNGYPVNSMSGILIMLECVINSEWDYILEQIDYDNLRNLIRGITWNTYQNFYPPTMGRGSFEYNKHMVEGNQTLKMHLNQALTFAETLVTKFNKYFEKDIRLELENFIKLGALDMPDDNSYYGTKYFFNNDSLISKNKSRFFYMSMASKRCNGTESAKDMADKRNFFLNDGLHFIQKDDKSYKEVLGTWNMTHLPGITTRHIEKADLMPETNWSGYNSLYEFAGGVGRGNNGVAAFIYEKDDFRPKDGAGVVRNEYTKEMMGVMANKASFVHGDLIVFLGSNVTDKKSEFGNDILTTVNNVKANNTKIISKNNEIFTGETEFNEDIYIENDGILYGIHPKNNQKILVKSEARRTDWAYYNFTNNSDNDTDVDVFEVNINHGIAPKEDLYEFWAYTNNDKTYNEVNSMFDVKINTAETQIVSFNNEVIESVFYKAGVFESKDLHIEVDCPVVVMIEKLGNDDYEIFVSDPYQNTELKEVNLKIRLYENGNLKKVKIKLPENEMRGCYASKIISIINPNSQEYLEFIEVNNLDEKIVVEDNCLGDWKRNWSLDGECGRVYNDDDLGMEMYSGPRFGNDLDHMVLWSNESFSGDIKISYDYTRLDNADKCVNIIYLLATGSGDNEHDKDVLKWSNLRKKPSMYQYFDNMNCYHISYAAFGLDAESKYIRARRYKCCKLQGTELAPDYDPATLFEPMVEHKLTFIKKDDMLYFHIYSEESEKLCVWKLTDNGELQEGRIGLRQMYTRSSRYKNIKISNI